MTEYNYFCYAEKYNDKDSFQQKRYRVFNVEVGEEAYDKIEKIYHKLEFDKNESYSTRYQTAFKKMWDKLSEKDRQEYFDIPHFDKDIFKEITGIEQSEVKELTKDEKAAIELLNKNGYSITKIKK